MRNRGIRRFVVVVVLLLASVWPACAEAAMRPRSAAAVRSASDTIVLADSWGVGHFLSGGGRARVIQVSVVAMGIALFIMMRKFNR